MFLFLIIALVQWLYSGTTSEEQTNSVSAGKQDIPAPSPLEMTAEPEEPPKQPSIIMRLIRHFIKAHLRFLHLILRAGGFLLRIFRFSRQPPPHPTVPMRPLDQREKNLPVQLIAKGVDITLRHFSGNGEESADFHSLLHDEPIVEQSELLASHENEDGFQRLENMFIEIASPNTKEDYSAEAATTGLRLLYMTILKSALTPGVAGAVDRFVLDEFPYIRCRGKCEAFHREYASIMHASAGIFWEAVESIDEVDHSTAISGKGASLAAYMQDLAKKRQILFANRKGKYRVVPLPVEA